jgi:hypothetical protein
MARLVSFVLALAVAGVAWAAPNVTNTTQKGSLLIFPDIRVDTDARGPWNTVIRIQNDGPSSIEIVCHWMDGNKNRVQFVATLTRDQAAWFDARSGQGSSRVNRFPQSVANGFDNPYLITPPATDEALDTLGPYFKGTLVCFAVNPNAEFQVKWNHLSGTATVFHPVAGAYEYNAYSFVAPTGLDGTPVGTPGVLLLDGIEYDACPLYQIGQFTPIGSR